MTHTPDALSRHSLCDYAAMQDFAIHRCTVADIFDSPDFEALCAEYAEESSRNEKLYDTKPDRAAYAHFEAMGIMQPLGAYHAGKLVGFCAVLLSPVLHSEGKRIATTESLFIAKAHRRGLVGVDLLDAAQAVATECGADGLYVSAPTGGRLISLLGKIGFTESNRTFYRAKAEE